MVPWHSLTHALFCFWLLLALFCSLSFYLVPTFLKEDRASRSLAKTGDGKRLDALDVVFGAKAIFIREGV